MEDGERFSLTLFSVRSQFLELPSSLKGNFLLLVKGIFLGVPSAFKELFSASSRLRDDFLLFVFCSMVAFSRSSLGVQAGLSRLRLDFDVHNFVHFSRLPRGFNDYKNVTFRDYFLEVPSKFKQKISLASLTLRATFSGFARASFAFLDSSSTVKPLSTAGRSRAGSGGADR